MRKTGYLSLSRGALVDDIICIIALTAIQATRFLIKAIVVK